MQLSNQLGPSIGPFSTQQSVQPAITVSAPGLVQQLGPSTPRTLPQTTLVAIFVQPSTPIPRVSAALVFSIPQISVQIPQVSIPKLEPTIQTTVQMPAGQVGSSTIASIQP